MRLRIVGITQLDECAIMAHVEGDPMHGIDPNMSLEEIWQKLAEETQSS